jgi:hypothetical protein
MNGIGVTVVVVALSVFSTPALLCCKTNFHINILFLPCKSKEDMSSAGEQLISNRIYDSE